jgi:hypothetical protein
VAFAEPCATVCCVVLLFRGTGLHSLSEPWNALAIGVSPQKKPMASKGYFCDTRAAYGCAQRVAVPRRTRRQPINWPVWSF